MELPDRTTGSEATSVLIRVEDEPPRTRLDYFRHVVADTIVPLDLRIDADRDIQAQILTGRVGTVQVTSEAALAPGDFTLEDLSRPCHLADRDDEHDVLAVVFRGRCCRTAIRCPPVHPESYDVPVTLRAGPQDR
jgi:hypothetical protein